MSDKEILEKAIQKAIGSGWILNDLDNPDKLVYKFYNDKICSIGNINNPHAVKSILFDHDFAKALWKSPKKPKYIWQPKESGLWEYDGGYMPDFIGEKWEYHLQQMVISDNPIKYLGENI